MDFDIKSFFGTLSVLVALGSYVPYIFHIYKGKTKPHSLSWFGWFLSTGVIFVVQGIHQAGPGAWAMGASALACLIISIAGFWVGERKFDNYDWLTILFVIIGICIWLTADNALLAVIIIATTDTASYIPALRKALRKPNEETLITFFLVAIKHALSLIAIQHFIIVNWLYPVVFLLVNGSYAAIVYLRRRQINNLV